MKALICCGPSPHHRKVRVSVERCGPGRRRTSEAHDTYRLAVQVGEGSLR